MLIDLQPKKTSLHNRYMGRGIKSSPLAAERSIRRDAKTFLGQNRSGQNGTDKMVWTKWYTDKMVLDKMVRTKWYGQNGMDKTNNKIINQYINSTSIDNMIFSSILLPL